MDAAKLSALPEDSEEALTLNPDDSSSSPKLPPISAFDDRPATRFFMYTLQELMDPLCFVSMVVVIQARQMKEKAQVVAMDMRGHGRSCTDNDKDMSIETLCNDVLAVLKALYGDSAPAIILVGHSMGGSVAVHLAAKKVIKSLEGLIVVDVVEGTAMASLIHMQKILASRPQYFHSIEKAIEWSVKGGSLRNVESARVSVRSTLKYDESKKCYTFRACLEETEGYWKGWYEGLSEKFLSSPVPKLLLLAGTDRLDRSLTIGQMQGKFQMVVVRHTGHAIQEDVSDEFAGLVLNFISRNRIGPHGVQIPLLRRPLQ
ncbi:protein phosphatase methylesterase 1 isoform X4 [Amborella trichopoda]|uniref:protein phosphatase methylesterase 1 isoform X4 n=1 Tax=Amborella trichopoda TaxID=13333 RepID=UPI0009BE96F4|nr:protein phosphatase methylesterase 1 isoform X4 [Amborella trichopoda]|eukprot:XP_020519045.1 protein phosphatase methylesterase 1 isoform X4 [Amborella trichopoda]